MTYLTHWDSNGTCRLAAWNFLSNSTVTLRHNEHEIERQTDRLTDNAFFVGWSN